MAALNGERGLPRSALGPNSRLFAMKIADLETKSALSQISQTSWPLYLRKHVKINEAQKKKKPLKIKIREQLCFTWNSGNQFLQLLR